MNEAAGLGPRAPAMSGRRRASSAGGRLEEAEAPGDEGDEEPNDRMLPHSIGDATASPSGWRRLRQVHNLLVGMTFALTPFFSFSDVNDGDDIAPG